MRCLDSESILLGYVGRADVGRRNGASQCGISTRWHPTFHSMDPATPELLHEVGEHGLRIAEQHPRVVLHVQLVVDAGEARILTALHGEDRFRLVGVDERHVTSNYQSGPSTCSAGSVWNSKKRTTGYLKR